MPDGSISRDGSPQPRRTARPTPADVAAVYRSTPKETPETSELTTLLRLHFAGLCWVAEQVGLDLDESLTQWVSTSDAESVAAWLDPSTSGAALAKRWSQISRATSANLLAALVQEQVLSHKAAKVAPWFRGYGYSFAEELLRSRTRVAAAALDHGYQTMPRNKRTVTTRALRLTVTYLQHILAHHQQAAEAPHPRELLRFGRAVVLLARYSPLDESMLTDAVAALRESRTRGVIEAAVYELEAHIHLYDASESVDHLQHAAFLTAHVDSTPPGVEWHLNCAESWLKLAAARDTGLLARTAFLDRSTEAITRCRTLSLRSFDKLRLLMLETFNQVVRRAGPADDVSMRWITLPFILRDNNRDLPPVMRLAAPALVAALEPVAREGEYVVRDVVAELLSWSVRHLDLPVAERQRMLHTAISLRDGKYSHQALYGERVQVQQGQDHLLLAQLEHNDERRRVGLDLLARAARGQRAAALTMIAREIEANDAFRGPVLSAGYGPLAGLIRQGNANQIYAEAAKAAITNPDHRRLRLGGRGDVVALDDVSALSGQTFVYKRMHADCQARDEARSAHIATSIAADGLADRFAVVDHVALVELPLTDPLASAGDHVVSVRKFAHGTPLATALRSPGRRSELLDQVAEYLAYIQSKENTPDLVSSGVRRTLKEREVGRWMRAFIGPEDASPLFNRWWALVSEAPLLPRRDAHVHNWIVGDDNRVIALDFDAREQRPFGFELAQLLEDDAVLDPADWDGRLRLLKRYLDHLRDYGDRTDLPAHEAEQFLAAGMIARALWLVTSPASSDGLRRHGGELLRQVGLQYAEAEVGELARSLHLHWSRMIGVATPDHLDTLHLADRRRISRAMAYHLRHDAAAPVSRHGWMHVDELVEVLTQGGHRVTVDQIRQIAGALGEPRFELEGDEIRARYAHSRVIPSGPLEDLCPSPLYHGTPVGALASVFEAQSGLLPQTRQFVHLTSDARVATRSSRRRGTPSIILRFVGPSETRFHKRSGEIWLIPRVPAADLQIMTLHELDAVT